MPFVSPLPRAGHPPYRLLRGLHEGLVRRFDRALADPEGAQRALLAEVLQEVDGTAFARAFGLDGVRSLEALRARLPVAGWERVAPWVARAADGEARVLTRGRVEHLLETSGTTGAAKRIPVTAAWARGVSEAQTLWLLGLLREHPALAEGAALTLVSPAEKGRTRGGIPVGSNTGRMHLSQPWWVRRRYPVPYEAYCLPDPEQRLYAVLRFALQADVRSLTTANPTTVLLIARTLRERADDLAADLSGGTLRHGPAASLTPATRAALERRLRRVPVPRDWHPARLWTLEVVNCWRGGLAGWFLPLLPAALGAPVPVREVGISASETFAAIPIAGGEDACVAWPLGEVLEWVADDGSIKGLWELDVGAEYRLVITGRNGLLRYDLGDVLRVVGHLGATPLLRFVRRAGQQLSATGEKLTESHLLTAMRDCATTLDLGGAGFTLRLVLAERPWYELAIEAPEPAVAALPALLDEALGRHNVEYASKRRSGRLDPVRVHSLPAGTYAALRRRRVAEGVPEGQYKHPSMALDEAAWEALMEAVARAGDP